jgi:hypothetical protein
VVGDVERHVLDAVTVSNIFVTESSLTVATVEQ